MASFRHTSPSSGGSPPSLRSSLASFLPRARRRPPAPPAPLVLGLLGLRRGSDGGVAGGDPSGVGLPASTTTSTLQQAGPPPSSSLVVSQLPQPSGPQASPSPAAAAASAGARLVDGGGAADAAVAGQREQGPVGDQGPQGLPVPGQDAQGAQARRQHPRPQRLLADEAQQGRRQPLRRGSGEKEE